MTVRQQVVEVERFAQYLRDMTAVLDPVGGWFGVFSARDPQGMAACLDGVEVPPWDVVESLLQDLAALRGARFAERESLRAAALHSASVAAHDRRPGGRHVLAARLEQMRREREHAVRRLEAAGATANGANGAAAPPGEAQAWARDDLERATARCAELGKRLAAVTASVPDDWFRDGGGGGAASRGRTVAVPAEQPPPSVPQAQGTAGETPPAPARRRGKPRGARFAGLETDDGAEGGPAPSAVPVLPAPAVTAGAAPRGARFRGAPVRDSGGTPDTTAAASPTVDAGARAAADEVVELLARLRAQGRSGEAHAVLCEAAAWPADRLPVLADALHRTGLDADRVTLLWELSTVPPAELAAAAAALTAAGRPGDCEQLLRQGVARPAAEIAEAVVALGRAGRDPEARALLGAFVRVRTPQDAASLAQGDPRRIVPQLLDAAREVSAAREWDLRHALRMAGILAP